MVTVVENNTQGEMITISISVPPSMIEQVGELVNQIYAKALIINGSVGASKDTPAQPVNKKLNRKQRQERNFKRFGHLKT